MSAVFSQRAVLVVRLAVLGLLAACVAVVLLFVWRARAYEQLGEPIAQPIPFSHKHHVGDDGIDGNPLSASSQRAQADTQRNINQQTRIANGVKDGSLTHHEAAGLERGQSHVDAREARAGANGNVSAGEQRRIARADNRQSARIHRQRHDAQVHG